MTDPTAQAIQSNTNQIRAIDSRISNIVEDLNKVSLSAKKYVDDHNKLQDKKVEKLINTKINDLVKKIDKLHDIIKKIEKQIKKK